MLLAWSIEGLKIDVVVALGSCLQVAGRMRKRFQLIQDCLLLLNLHVQLLRLLILLVTLLDHVHEGRLD